MVAILNITKGKNKVIMSGLAGVLSALIFLTAIHIAAKIAIIASTTIVTYLLLSLIHKMRTKEDKPAKIDEVSEDKEKDIVISGEEPEKTEAELEEELIRKKAEEEMKKGLHEHMDFKGNSLPKNLDDDTSQTKYVTNYMDLMRSPPMHMNGCYQEITKATDVPRTVIHIEPGNKSTQKLSATEWLHGMGYNQCSVRVPEQLTMEYILSQRG